MYDIFISYRRENGAMTARLLYDRFTDMGLSVFLDLEELSSGRFDVALYNRIEESKNVVVILSPNSLNRCMNDGDWLRNEVVHAMKCNKNIVPFMLKGFSFPSALPDDMKGFPTYNAVKVSTEYLDASIEKLASLLTDVVFENTDSHSSSESVIRDSFSNKYFSSEDRKEVRRLKIQRELVAGFDNPTYQYVEGQLDELRVLDVGSNDGDYIFGKFGSSGKMKKLVGLEYDKTAVEKANRNHGNESDFRFYEADIESDTLAETIENAMDDLGIESFNVINISMVLLHLNNPYRLLKTIRKYLQKDGYIIIKDIDDGFNVAYPDPDGLFAKAVKICSKCEESGFRYSGRRIFTLLEQTGYRDISLQDCGINTVGMDYDQREAFFNIYFGFIIDDIRDMAEKHPEVKEYREDYQWFKNTYEKLESMFQIKEFFFSLGFMIYLAKK